MGKKLKDHIKFAKFCAKHALVMGKEMVGMSALASGKIDILIPKSEIRELLNATLDEIEYASVKTDVFMLLQTVAEGVGWENTHLSDDDYAYRLQFAMKGKW